MIRPLGLPVGSVRALLLLALAVRAVFDVRADGGIAPWLLVALLLAAASYFAARSTATEGGTPPKQAPLWLPAGTIRVVVLLVVMYGTYVWARTRPEGLDSLPILWIFLGAIVGLIMRVVMRKRRGYEEAAASYFEHVLALVTLICAVGLVYYGVQRGTAPPTWVPPFLGTIIVHYFATR